MALFKEETYKGSTDADIIWKLDMMKELGVVQHNMANSSPAIWADLVFVETSNGQDENHEKITSPRAPSFIAVDKNTGKVVWKDNSPGRTHSCTANGRRRHWAKSAGVQQVFFPGGDGWLYGFDARTGEKLWSFDPNPKDAVWPKTRNYVIATPVFHDGKVFLAVGQDPENGEGIGHMYCIDPTRRGDITESGRVWHYDKIRRSISTAAIPDGLVYISDFTGFLHCLDCQYREALLDVTICLQQSGDPLSWQTGKFTSGTKTAMSWFSRRAKSSRKLSEINMGSAIYGTPVAANGVLYIMNRMELYAIHNQ